MMCAHTSLQFVRILLPEWTTLTLEVMDLKSSLKHHLETRLRPVGRRLKGDKALQGNADHQTCQLI